MLSGGGARQQEATDRLDEELPADLLLIHLLQS